MKIVKGDTVIITKGKDRGREGVVTEVSPRTNTVVIEGLNVYKKHVKAQGNERPGGIIDISRPLPVANVMLLCPATKKPTRVGYKMVDGQKVRYCKVSGEVLTGSAKGNK